MTRVYDRAMQNLLTFGVPSAQVNGALSWSCHLLRAITVEEKEAIDEATEVLQGFLEGTRITQYLRNTEGAITLEEAVEKTLGNGSKVLGVTGKPATGKSTFCQYIQGQEIEIFDEMWPAGKTTEYERNLQALYCAKSQGKTIVAAACQLGDALVDTRLHFISPPKIRLHHLQARMRESSDRLRVKYFEAYEVYDDLLFGLEKLNADVVVNNTEIRY